MRFCSIRSGSSGNCSYIEIDDKKFLIDAGFSGRFIQKELEGLGVNMSEIDAILLTHEHKDHSKGVGVLSRRFDIPIYANEKTHAEISGFIGAIDEKNRKILKTGDENSVLGTYVETISLKHDSVDPIGFIFGEDNKKLSYITDTGEVSQKTLERIKDSDFYFLEANYDPIMLIQGPYPAYLKGRVLGQYGHLSNEDSASVLLDNLRGEGEAVYLAHISETNNTEDHCFSVVKEILESAGLKIGDSLRMKVASRYYRGDLVEI